MSSINTPIPNETSIKKKGRYRLILALLNVAAEAYLLFAIVSSLVKGEGTEAVGFMPMFFFGLHMGLMQLSPEHRTAKLHTVLGHLLLLASLGFSLPSIVLWFSHAPVSNPLLLPFLIVSGIMLDYLSRMNHLAASILKDGADKVDVMKVISR